jgi:hypothetical protein
MPISKVEFDNTVLLDLTGDTVISEFMFNEATAHDAAGNEITGIWEMDDLEITPSDQDQTFETIEFDEDYNITYAKAYASIEVKAVPASSNLLENGSFEYIIGDPDIENKDVSFELTVDNYMVNALLEGNFDKDFYIPASVTKIRDYAFEEVKGLENIYFHENVRSLGENVFYFSKISHVYGLSSNLTSIESSCFCGMYLLNQSDIIENTSIATLNYGTFSYCTSLTSIKIPGTVTKIDRRCFTGCTSLESVILASTEPPTLDSTSFQDLTSVVFYVPDVSVNAYKAADIWCDYADRIKAVSEYKEEA